MAEIDPFFERPAEQAPMSGEEVYKLGKSLMDAAFNPTFRGIDFGGQMTGVAFRLRGIAIELGYPEELSSDPVDQQPSHET